MKNNRQPVAIVLKSEGLGDCLFAIPVIKKLHSMLGRESEFAIFTVHTGLYRNCPYVNKVHDFHDTAEMARYKKHIVLFNQPPHLHSLMDTFDYISIPVGIGELSFREKQLEYFPVEEDGARRFDVVINTSFTWPSRSWPLENWQGVADFILERGYSVAVVGKDVLSKLDNLWKRSRGLKGCVDLTNKLSLDQTFYTIKKSGLFITCQNGLSVLGGATDTEVIVLDMSIEWSKRAIYRNEDPHYRVTYVKGDCDIYCREGFNCPVYGEFRCIPEVEKVIDIAEKKLPHDPADPG
jgi:ADP-heptose:LPS heptosyltransferase